MLGQKTEETGYDAAVAKIRPLTENQLYAVLCEIAYDNPELVIRAATASEATGA